MDSAIRRNSLQRPDQFGDRHTIAPGSRFEVIGGNCCGTNNRCRIGCLFRVKPPGAAIGKAPRRLECEHVFKVFRRRPDGDHLVIAEKTAKPWVFKNVDAHKPDRLLPRLEVDENRFAVTLQADIMAILPVTGLLGDQGRHALALFDTRQQKIIVIVLIVEIDPR